MRAYPATASASSAGVTVELGVAPAQTDPVGICCGIVGVPRSYKCAWSVKVGLVSASAGRESSARSLILCNVDLI